MARLPALALLGLTLACAQAETQERARGDSADPYIRYVREAPEFHTVQAVAARRWDTWIYMPWRYRWTIGTGEAGGRFCRDFGINGGMTDHGEGPLDWLARWNLRFYNDHTAGKGDLYLEPRGLDDRLRDPGAIRPRPLDRALIERLKATVTERVRKIEQSPLRIAYALDDEASWGSFSRPAVWRINGDDAAYERWLGIYYGVNHGGAAPPARWVMPGDLFPQLGRPLREIDLSPLLDRMSYNDSVWANLLGELAERCQTLDPETPCGLVGAQGPGLRLRQAGEEGALRRGLRPRFLPRDPPLVRPRQPDPAGDHPLPR